MVQATLPRNPPKLLKRNSHDRSKKLKTRLSCLSCYGLQSRQNFAGSPTSMNMSSFLALSDIEHTKTKAKNPQTNGICKRFHRTVKEEFYSIALRRKIYLRLEELQGDLDLWMENTTKRGHTRENTVMDGQRWRHF